MVDNPLEGQNMNEEELAMNEASKHVEQNTVLVVPGEKCVDGRYLDEDGHTGKIAMAGGDFGIVLALLAVNKSEDWGLSVKDCVEGVYQAVIKEGEEFGMHTDEGASGAESEKEPTPRIGCGHGGRAQDPEYAPMYGVNPKQVEEAIVLLKKRQMEGGKIKITNLKGPHLEKRVLIIEGRDKTVKPALEGFIYDATRAQDHISKVVGNMSLPIPTEQALSKIWNAFNYQTNATLRILAPNLPIIGVKYQESKPVLEFRGRVSDALPTFAKAA